MSNKLTNKDIEKISNDSKKIEEITDNMLPPISIITPTKNRRKIF